MSGRKMGKSLYCGFRRKAWWRQAEAWLVGKISGAGAVSSFLVPGPGTLGQGRGLECKLSIKDVVADRSCGSVHLHTEG